MAPGQENLLHPPTPQGNQTCPTQRQPWRLDTDGGPESDPTPPRLSMGYRTLSEEACPNSEVLVATEPPAPTQVQLALDFHLVCPFLRLCVVPRTPGVDLWGAPAWQPVGALALAVLILV